MDYSAIVLALLPMIAGMERPRAAPVPHPQVIAAAAMSTTLSTGVFAKVSGAESGARDLSDAYYNRLAVHRVASYAILPLFALQLAAGTKLFDESISAPNWAKVGHRVGATGVAALFATNLITGIPNLIESRREPEDRGRRTFHAVMMLAASAGFTATGLIAERAEGSPSARAQHRAVAYTSMAVATVGYLSMLDFFRRD